jgi:uncharacterized membrane protein YeaQ/YmgE (transglycosylase-associated protein family)
MGAFVGLIIAIVIAVLLVSLVFNVVFTLFVPVLIAGVIGWLAARLVDGRGYGVLSSILLGLGGGILGSIVWNAFGLPFGGGVIGAIVSGTVGAVILIYGWRLLNGRSSARR